jgi:dihydroneopterin aldolase
MADRIELRGLRVLASVGALPEEHERAQPLEIDLDVEADLRPAGESDRLVDTIDYAALCDAALGVFVEHIVLLEAVAERIAVATRAVDDRITGVTVTVRKVRPPVPHDLATSAVTIVR